MMAIFRHSPAAILTAKCAPEAWFVRAQLLQSPLRSVVSSRAFFRIAPRIFGYQGHQLSGVAGRF